MGLGLGIILLVLGAIATFAIEYEVAGVDITVIGYILMAAGVLALLFGLVFTRQRTNTSHTEVVDASEDVNVRRRGERP